jgi:hypothetical protein
VWWRWRVKAARVVYGHFYFSMCEALLPTESGSGGGPVHTGVLVVGQFESTDRGAALEDVMDGFQGNIPGWILV